MKKFILLFVIVSAFNTTGQTTLSKQRIDKTFEAFSDKSPLIISARSQPQCLEDSTISSNWDSLTTNWVNDTRIRYFYNSDYLVGLQIKSTWNKAAQKWVDNLRTSNYYDVNKRLIKSVDEVKSATTGQWRPDYQLSSVVYTNNDVTTQTFQAWDTIQSVWVNHTRRSYTYNSNHNMLTDTYERWTGSWMALMLNTATYDASFHYIDLISLYWDYSTNNWGNTFKQTSFVYDANNNITSYLILDWDQVNNAWSNAYKITRSYNSANNVLTETELMWQASAWQNYSISTNTYNASNQLINSSYDMWNLTSFMNLQTRVYTYDSYNNQTSFILNLAIANSPVGPYAYIRNFFNCSITGVKEQSPNAKEFHVFPNPVINELTIQTPVEYSEIRIFDTNGKQVLKSEVTETISLARLNPGVYSVCLMNKDERVICSSRFIKLP